MAVLLPIAFLAGLITAFTPCILPVLPILLAGGGTGTRRKPYAIVAGLVTTFTAFTLAGAWILQQLHLGKTTQTKVAVAMLLLLSLTLIVPKVGELLERPFLFLTRRRAGDLGGGFVLGASLGLVFVPCAGPVFGAVSTLAGERRVGVSAVFVAIAYAVGATLPMLVIARGSLRLMTRFRANAQGIRIAAGVLMAVGAVAIYEGWETSLQTKVPGYASSIQHWIEGNGTVNKRLSALRGNEHSAPFKKAKPSSLASELKQVPLKNYGTAPDFQRIEHWLNTPGERPLTLQGLRGKVVLIDFWTYSCINCLRTLPYLERWDKRYRSQGLVIVGVHTPEFQFEYDLGNVRKATSDLGVGYPVALDNAYGTWNAYSNQYWPAEYLIDQNGEVRHVHFGEGEYDKTEQTIRLLLAAGGHSSLPHAGQDVDLTPTGPLTPESYLGYSRIDRYAGSPVRANKPASYRFPLTLPPDNFAYAGTWTVQGERIVAGRSARLRLHFQARKVHLVLGGSGTVRVTLDGRAHGQIRVTGDRLYTLVRQQRTRTGTLELAFTPGVKAYAFTFG